MNTTVRDFLTEFLVQTDGGGWWDIYSHVFTLPLSLLTFIPVSLRPTTPVLIELPITMIKHWCRTRLKKTKQTKTSCQFIILNNRAACKLMERRPKMDVPHWVGKPLLKFMHTVRPLYLGMWGDLWRSIKHEWCLFYLIIKLILNDALTPAADYAAHSATTQIRTRKFSIFTAKYKMRYKIKVRFEAAVEKKSRTGSRVGQLRSRLEENTAWLNFW